MTPANRFIVLIVSAVISSPAAAAPDVPGAAGSLAGAIVAVTLGTALLVYIACRFYTKALVPASAASVGGDQAAPISQANPLARPSPPSLKDIATIPTVQVDAGTDSFARTAWIVLAVVTAVLCLIAVLLAAAATAPWIVASVTTGGCFGTFCTTVNVAVTSTLLASVAASCSGAGSSVQCSTSTGSTSPDALVSLGLIAASIPLVSLAAAAVAMQLQALSVLGHAHTSVQRFWTGRSNEAAATPRIAPYTGVVAIALLLLSACLQVGAAANAQATINQARSLFGSSTLQTPGYSLTIICCVLTASSATAVGVLMALVSSRHYHTLALSGLYVTACAGGTPRTSVAKLSSTSPGLARRASMQRVLETA